MLVNLLGSLNKALDLTTLIVSHDLAETAAIADKLYLVARGQVLASGSPAELQKSGDPQVAQFMQGLPDGPVPFHYPARDYADDMLGEKP